MATQADVTARIEAAETVDRTRARMGQALAATEDAFLVLESDGRVASANDAVRSFFPAPGVDWALGTHFVDNWRAYLQAAEDLPGRVTRLLRRADLQTLADVPRGQELDLPDGRSVLLRAAKLEDGGLVLNGTDVTPMKSAQRLLAQRLAAMEAAPDGLAVVDEGGRLLYLNSAAARLMGYRSATSGLGRVWWHQYRNRLEMSSLQPFEPSLAELDDAANSRHEVTSSPLENRGSVIVVRDVTEKLNTAAREEELNQQLDRLQRQDAIAQVTAGVAHDFNNTLAAINGSATLIEMEPDLPEAVRGHVQRISLAGTQASKLISRLLDIGAGVAEDHRFALAGTLNDLPELVAPMLARGVTLQVDPVEAQLRGDPGGLTQVLINLVLNASEAIGSEGQITVTATIVEGDPDIRLDVGSLRSGTRYARLDVVDTGSGMPPETAEKVFEPYFTTKGRQGTGLGMAMVAAQLKSVGGAVALSSEVGKGTTISLFWPVSVTESPDVDVAPAERVDLSGRTMIVVDDDPHVGEVVTRYLEAQGAEAVHCQDPIDALEAVEDAPEAWTAVISDYDMPIMNGGELTQKIKSAAPNLPVIIVTALAKRLNDPRLVNGQAAAILPKPLDIAALNAALIGAVPPLAGAQKE